jgi:plastocyanin
MRRISLILGLLTCAGGLLAPARAGDIRGRIVISRSLTKKRVPIPNYQMRGVSVPSESLEPAADEEYKRLAVYLEAPSATTPQEATANLFQRNIEFQPEVAVVPLGSTVSFPNGDPIFHNVFSLSPVKKFDLGFYPEGETRTVTFDRAGVVQVYCHLHPDMNAAILVVPNSWFVQPGPEATFSFSGVPAGKYRVVVWHKSAGFFRKTIEVPENGHREVSFDIPAPEATAR